MMASIRRIIWLTEQITLLKQQVAALEMERERILQAASAEAADLLSGPQAERVSDDPVSANEVVSAIEQVGEVDASELARLLSITYDGARLRLARYAKRGLVVRVSKGKYRVSQARQMRFHVNGALRIDQEEEEEKGEPPSGARD